MTSCRLFVDLLGYITPAHRACLRKAERARWGAGGFGIMPRKNLIQTIAKDIEDIHETTAYTQPAYEPALKIVVPALVVRMFPSQQGDASTRLGFFIWSPSPTANSSVFCTASVVLCTDSMLYTDR